KMLESMRITGGHLQFARAGGLEGVRPPMESTPARDRPVSRPGDSVPAGPQPRPGDLLRIRLRTAPHTLPAPVLRDSFPSDPRVESADREAPVKRESWSS